MASKKTSTEPTKRVPADEEFDDSGEGSDESSDDESSDESSDDESSDESDNEESNETLTSDVDQLKTQLQDFKTDQATQHKEITTRFTKLQAEIDRLLNAHDMATPKQRFTLSSKHESELQEIFRQLICDRCLLVEGDLDEKLKHIKALLLRFPA